MRLSYNTANILLGACLLLLHLAMATSQGPADSQAAAKVPLMLENQSEGDVTTLDMSSGSASVELGPVVVNEDGESQALFFLSSCGKTHVREMLKMQLPFCDLPYRNIIANHKLAKDVRVGTENYIACFGQAQ